MITSITNGIDCPITICLQFFSRFDAAILCFLIRSGVSQHFFLIKSGYIGVLCDQSNWHFCKTNRVDLWNLCSITIHLVVFDLDLFLKVNLKSDLRFIIRSSFNLRSDLKIQAGFRRWLSICLEFHNNSNVHLMLQDRSTTIGFAFHGKIEYFLNCTGIQVICSFSDWNACVQQ